MSIQGDEWWNLGEKAGRVMHDALPASLNFTALLLESAVALSSHVTAFEIIARQTIYLGIWRLTD